MRLKETLYRSVAALSGLGLSMAVLGDCLSETDPCSSTGSVEIGRGCSTSGNDCCAYRTYKCIGSATTWTVRVLFFNDGCTATSPHHCPKDTGMMWPPYGPPGDN